MSNSVLGLSIDSADAAKLAQFWPTSSAERSTPSQPPSSPPSTRTIDNGPRPAFHQVPEAKTAPRWVLPVIAPSFRSDEPRPGTGRERCRCRRPAAISPGSGEVLRALPGRCSTGSVLRFGDHVHRRRFGASRRSSSG